MRVGYVGKDNVPVGVALAGVLHYERDKDFVALCNGKELNYIADPQSILDDKGLAIHKLRICKHCQAKERAR